MKRLIVLGSTGSIGTNALDLAARYPERFNVAGLTAGSNDVKLEQQIRRFRPAVAALRDEAAADRLRRRCAGLPTKILSGEEGVRRVAGSPEGDLVISAIVGAAGLLPTVAALQAGKDVALSNKETLVMAGGWIREEARRRKAAIFPVDSEHSAIFQAMQGHRREDVKRVILTASGGPFLNLPAGRRRTVRPAQALRHPIWRMGAKITIDSATLMNKGLEVIEARWLFDLEPDRIGVLIHPQGVVHSMVEYKDGSVLAQMGIADMRLPLSYAMNYPERLPLPFPSLDLARMEKLSFRRPSLRQFPCLGYAYEAIRMGGTLPAVLNAANEEAVAAFLSKRIGFLGIPRAIRRTLEDHTVRPIRDIQDVLEADRWARERASNYISAMKG
jgi:1-deoxy-D-xylulose-5-phosphate reductoisomerase